MEQIHGLLKNFHEFLKSSLPYLRHAEVTVGSDEWDEFTEATFQLMVLSPVEESLGVSIDWTYETWPSEDSGARIGLKILGEEEIWSAVENRELSAKPSEYKAMRFAYKAAKPPVEPILFRGFSHPWMDPSESDDWLDYVEGEVLTGKTSPRGEKCRICVPLQRCQFRVFLHCEDHT